MPFKLVGTEGRTLRLTVQAGGAPCDGVRKVAVRETPSTVTVTVTTGAEPHAKCGPGVVAMIGTLPVEARLKSPLGTRRLIDGAP
ncbi:hypothetical protein [Solirubrobacter soli]|uniref:hypothetical protein n=1 Tax=Solirubrobacter soli TaxID=363832 RepID=UPI000419D793|nr:hypothetical protein [Solirubrobacter soli]